MPRIIENLSTGGLEYVKILQRSWKCDQERFRRRLGRKVVSGTPKWAPAYAFLVPFAPIDWFWTPCLTPSDFEGIPKTTIFETIQNRMKKIGPRNGFEKTWFVDLFLMLKWGLKWKRGFRIIHVAIFRDLGSQENWSKKGCQKSSKMVPKSSFGHPGSDFWDFGGIW